MAEHLGQHPPVEHHHHNGHQHVEPAHKGHQGGGEADDALAAAHDAVPHHCRQNGADDPGGSIRIVEGIAGEGGLEVVGRQHVEAPGIGEDQRPGENHCQGAAVEGGLDIIGGAAVALPGVGIPALIDLGQSGLHKGGSPADKGNDPHPEHGAVAAAADGGGDSDDVASAHPGSRGHHQRLKGGDGSGIVGLLPHHADGLGKHPELDKAGPEGEIHPCRDQQNNQDIRIEPVVERIDNGCEHSLFPLLFFHPGSL